MVKKETAAGFATAALVAHRAFGMPTGENGAAVSARILSTAPPVVSYTNTAPRAAANSTTAECTCWHVLCTDIHLPDMWSNLAVLV